MNCNNDFENHTDRYTSQNHLLKHVNTSTNVLITKISKAVLVD